MSAFVAFLREAGAHHDVVQWVSTSAPTLEATWETCPRGDWLLAIAARLRAPSDSLARAAVDCARLVVADADVPAAREALLVVEAVLDGTEPATHADEARDRAERAASDADDPLAVAILLAAAAACGSVRDPSLAAASAAHAVEAAVAGVPDCAMMSALGHMHRETARVARARVARPTLP
ncbi:MAG: hypothetical protein U0230_06995 [Polyangiales bacterium]